MAPDTSAKWTDHSRLPFLRDFQISPLVAAHELHRSQVIDMADDAKGKAAGRLWPKCDPPSTGLLRLPIMQVSNICGQGRDITVQARPARGRVSCRPCPDREIHRTIARGFGPR